MYSEYYSALGAWLWWGVWTRRVSGSVMNLRTVYMYSRRVVQTARSKPCTSKEHSHFDSQFNGQTLVKKIKKWRWNTIHTRIQIYTQLWANKPKTKTWISSIGKLDLAPVLWSFYIPVDNVMKGLWSEQFVEDPCFCRDIVSWNSCEIIGSRPFLCGSE